MDPAEIALLIAAGLAMGFVNNLAGAGGVLGLLGLELAAGLPPGPANTSLRLSALAIGGAGLVSFMLKGKRIPARAWLWALLAIPGALGGALLAVTLDPIAYQISLAAVLALLLWQQLAPRRPNPDATETPRSRWLGYLLFVGVGLHMGFIQIGTGLVAILALTHAFSRDLVEVNAVKMALVIVAALTSNAVLIASDAIVWSPALWTALGAGIGSFAAARWSVHVGHSVVRPMVILIAGLALVYTVWAIASRP